MPDKIPLSVQDICGDRTYTRDDGKPLYDKIAKLLKNGKSVTVDFSNKEIASESFLDEAIVEHFMRPVVANAELLIGLKNVSSHDQTLLKRIYAYRKNLESKISKKRPNKNISHSSAAADLVKDSDNEQL